MSKQKYPQTVTTSADGTTIKKGRAHYSHAKADAKQKRKRNEANERDALYVALTIPARIARAKSRRGESKREIARLEKLLTAPKTAPAAPTAPVTEKRHSPNKKGYKPSQDSLSTHASFA